MAGRKRIGHWAMGLCTLGIAIMALGFFVLHGSTGSVVVLIGIIMIVISLIGAIITFPEILSPF